MRVSRHAQERINERNISVEEIKECIASGRKCVNKHDETKWTFISNVNNVYCVVSKDLSVLITVFRREY